MNTSAAALAELRARPMVFVEDLQRPELDPQDRHHLQRSLRVRAGDPLTVSDGSGRWRSARFGPIVEPDGPVTTEARSVPQLAIGFAPVKGDRSELVVQKLTELGIDVIVPILTERSVVRWDEARAAKNLGRHRRIAREAAMQSRTPWLPDVQGLTDLGRFLSTGTGAVLADPEGLPLAAGHVSGPQRVAVAIGPEGGFSAVEVGRRETVALPGRILRTETAAIATAVLLASFRNRPA